MYKIIVSAFFLSSLVIPNMQAVGKKDPKNTEDTKKKRCPKSNKYKKQHRDCMKTGMERYQAEKRKEEWEQEQRRKREQKQNKNAQAIRFEDNFN